MRREDRFVMSHRPYAVKLDSLEVEVRTGHAGEYGSATMSAVWFRRKNGITAACVGELWDLQRPDPPDAMEFLTRHDDGRHGGVCLGRWDGERYWGATQDPDANAAYLALLRPMLAGFHEEPNDPTPAAGYVGWWVF